MENIKTLTDAALHYARKDLNEVIAIQEKAEREFPGSCPKLGRYWDDLHAVLGEISRRQNEPDAMALAKYAITRAP